jgi:hypothetical protein
MGGCGMNQPKLKRVYAVEDVNDFEIIFEFTDGAEVFKRFGKDIEIEYLRKWVKGIRPLTRLEPVYVGHGG